MLYYVSIFLLLKKLKRARNKAKGCGDRRFHIYRLMLRRQSQEELTLEVSLEEEEEESEGRKRMKMKKRERLVKKK